ncbi:hypothetical protein MJO29_003158 [Puccinia striiformis f. sp. tritici]|nr:hypothetical protein MJO29_003158 [Puccinia striiformis f. sp. tritici]
MNTCRLRESTARRFTRQKIYTPEDLQARKFCLVKNAQESYLRVRQIKSVPIKPSNLPDTFPMSDCREACCTCSICSEPIGMRNGYWLPCGADNHGFHRACLINWFDCQRRGERGLSCPTCRTEDLRPGISTHNPHHPSRVTTAPNESQLAVNLRPEVNRHLLPVAIPTRRRYTGWSTAYRRANPRPEANRRLLPVVIPTRRRYTGWSTAYRRANPRPEANRHLLPVAIPTRRRYTGWSTAYRRVNPVAIPTRRRYTRRSAAYWRQFIANPVSRS